jgi:hypothetical protein
MTSIPFAPIPITDTSARTMIKACGFPYVVDRLVQACLREAPPGAARRRGSPCDVGSGVALDPCLGAADGVTLLHVHIPFALDDASSNGLLVEYAKQYYKQQNTDLNFKVVVTITNTACVPHQLNIASLVGLANLGGGKPRDNKRFLSQFISATHTFATSTHVVKIWDGAVHTIEGTRLMTRVEAAREGIPVSDDEDFLLKVELLTFLACRIIGKASLTPKQKRLLEAMPGYLNSALVYWVSGAEPVRIVNVPGNGWTQDQCLDGLQFFLDRSATVFSEGRWGTATPSFAMQAFWELPHSLSHRALKRGFDRKKLEARIISIGDSTEEKDQFSKTLNTRLSSCFEFHDREAQSDYRSTLAVMTNDFIQISLQHAFAVDSRIVTDFKRVRQASGRREHARPRRRRRWFGVVAPSAGVRHGNLCKEEHGKCVQDFHQ